MGIGLLAVAGCREVDLRYDHDGDGVEDASDCAPDDGTIYPGAPDPFGDGVDQDCDACPDDAPPGAGDGVDMDCDGYPSNVDAGDENHDCNDADASKTREDGDGDGYTSCDEPPDCDDSDPALTPADDDLDTWTVCDGDCDDGDEGVHPEHAELCDGLDNDCDGSLAADEKDGDGDGWMACDGDCDDVNPDVNPDAPELVDGLDNDCDGSVDTWLAIPGGTFEMGDSLWDEQSPIHAVTVQPFEMLRSEVTVAQYAECVDAGDCSEPEQTYEYNWGVPGREHHPVNGVSWHQAVEFCTTIGGRLPTEAEWEHAARGAGLGYEYPWGFESASCAYAVMNDGGGAGCGEGHTWPVCSKPAGDSPQGLCDMAGNLAEWVQDWWHDSYDGAPTDGSAWEDPLHTERVIRNGSFYMDYVLCMDASHRDTGHPTFGYDFLGFRCVRDASSP